MAVSEPEKYADTITNRMMEPSKAPVDGSSKNGDLVFYVGVQLYEFNAGLSIVSGAPQYDFQNQFAAEIT